MKHTTTDLLENTTIFIFCTVKIGRYRIEVTENKMSCTNSNVFVLIVNKFCFQEQQLKSRVKYTEFDHNL